MCIHRPLIFKPQIPGKFLDSIVMTCKYAFITLNRKITFMKDASITKAIKFREKIFKIIPIIRSFPILSTAIFFLSLEILGIFEFEPSEESLSILYVIAEDHFWFIILPIIALLSYQFYMNHRRIKQKASPIIHLQKNRDSDKEKTMEDLRVKRTQKLLRFEFMRAGFKTNITLVSIGVVTLFVVLVLDRTIRGAHTLTITLFAFFTISGLALGALLWLQNSMERREAWGMMQNYLLENHKKMKFINHGIRNGNEALIKWLDSFWVEPMEINFAKRGIGFAFESDEVQWLIFADAGSAKIFNIFIALEVKSCAEEKQEALDKIVEDLKEWGFVILFHPNGIFVKATDDGIYEILKDFTKYDGEMIYDIMNKCRGAVTFVGGKPGPYYPLFVEK